MKPNLTRNQMHEQCAAHFNRLPDPAHALTGVVQRLIWPVRTTVTKSMLMAASQIMDFIDGEPS